MDLHLENIMDGYMPKLTTYAWMKMTLHILGRLPRVVVLNVDCRGTSEGSALAQETENNKERSKIDLGIKLDLDRVHIMYKPNQRRVVNQIQYDFFLAGNIRSGSGSGTM